MRGIRLRPMLGRDRPFNVKSLINLQNPWGSSHVKELPVKDFKRFYKALRIGDK